MKLNEKIIYCRRKAGLSQENLAELLNVSRQAVSKWGCCKCKLIAGNSLFPYAKYAYLSEEFCLRQ